MIFAIRFSFVLFKIIRTKNTATRWIGANKTFWMPFFAHSKHRLDSDDERANQSLFNRFVSNRILLFLWSVCYKRNIWANIIYESNSHNKADHSSRRNCLAIVVHGICHNWNIPDANHVPLLEEASFDRKQLVKHCPENGSEKKD